MKTKLQRWAGWFWMPAGILLFAALVYTAALQIAAHPQPDTWIQWGIFVFISLPICAGLSLFGWYAWQGDYADEPSEPS